MAMMLKNDWKARGNNPAAAKMAEWMNTVANLFNFATVPSGGTAEPTERGFQIEIDNDNKDHSFLPERLTATTATMTTGYIHAADGVRYQLGAITAVAPIDFSVNTHFWVNILYERVTGETYKVSTGISALQSGVAFPDLTSVDGLEIRIPLFRFDGNKFSGLVRHQTNDFFDAYRNYGDINGAPDINDPWPTPPNYGDIPDAPSTELPWPTPDEHANLSDIVDGTAGDDHSGTNFNYLANTGDEARNSMPANAYIGDGADKKSIYPHLRQLFAEIGGVTTLVLDWALQKLSGGYWTITDTTDAGAGTGALVVDGGLSVAKKVNVQDTTAAGDAAGAVVVAGGVYTGDGTRGTHSSAAWSAYYVTGGMGALLDGEVAGRFYNGIDESVDLCNGTYSVNAGTGINTEDVYYVQGTAGATETFQVTKDGVTKDAMFKGGLFIGFA